MDAEEINALGDRRPCEQCGYQSCDCGRDSSDCGGQTLDPPCGGCGRCIRKQFPVAHEPLDVLSVSKAVLQYEEVSYTKAPK